MLNRIWTWFFFVSFLAALFQWLYLGNSAIWQTVTQGLFDSAKLGFEIAIGLVGVLTLWLGLFNVAEQAGLIQWLAKALKPLFRRLMPEVPDDHPALGSVTMNLAANVLGLDNAATPMGIKAMESLQTINPKTDTASNAQIMFLVLNTSSVTLLPVTIFMYRAQLGASNPADVFLPILLATSCSTLVGLLVVAWVQRVKWYDPVVLAYLSGFALLMAALVLYLQSLSLDAMNQFSSLLGNAVLFSIVTLFLFVSWVKKQPSYDFFIDGAKEGFQTGVRLIPYLIAMLVAISALRSSGVLDGIQWVLSAALQSLGFDTQFVAALPTALMKPFSGSGARALMLEAMNHYGVDSFVGKMVAVMQGSTETTFYVLAVYFGVVGIKHIRYALWCGLIADAAGLLAAILISYWMF